MLRGRNDDVNMWFPPPIAGASGP
eukprot:COSAG01_NODE_53816_length_336_cov_1.080169_1_plen_23_part_10